MWFLDFNFATMFYIRKIKYENNVSSYEHTSWFPLSAAFPVTSMFDDPQIPLHYKLKHCDLKLRLN